jgi:6-pyruvoyltetrahydropterin/6-carboxytetrahydropterin synthase
MYTVGVRDHIMVAHRLDGEFFGPGQRMHGATYVVSAELEQEELDPHGVVVDIGMFRERLREVLADIDYRNLDEHPSFEPGRSTTEIIARYVHRELGRKLPFRQGSVLTIKLDESPAAWVKYRAPIRSGSIIPSADLGHA